MQSAVATTTARHEIASSFWLILPPISHVPLVLHLHIFQTRLCSYALKMATSVYALDFLHSFDFLHSLDLLQIVFSMIVEVVSQPCVP